MNPRIAAILTSALLASLHIACFDKPDAPHRGTGDGGTMNDGRLAIDASMIDAATCGPVHDDFNTIAGAPCGAWGSATNATVMMRTGTTLSIKPTFPGNGAACTSMLFDFSRGASIEIVQPIDGSGANTIFSVAAGGHTVGVQIAYGGVSGTQVRETCDLQSPVLEPYNAISHRWWRLAPAGTGVDMMSGSDGVNWSKSLLDNCPWGTTLTTVNANIGASAGSGTALPALYDNFNTNPCPPPS